MSDWRHGYFADGGYTYGCYPEIMPSRLNWAAALMGVDATTDRFRYLDLGCGQGLSLMMAATHYPDSEFVGIDFMPEHIAHGRELSARAGLKNVKFIEADFLTLSREAVGEFDYVVAHGITTWVSPEVRNALFKLASDVLRPGGIMYNSYNTYPGWLSGNPFQHLVLELQTRYSGHQALDIARKSMASLNKAKSPLFEQLPSLGVRLDRMGKQDPAYLVQEYNNRHWRPVYCSEMLRLAREHKLEFFGSATLPELFDNCYPTQLLALINTESDQVLRETIRDLGMSQSFRRDLYAKGTHRRWLLERDSALMSISFVRNRFVPIPMDGQPFKFISGGVDVEGERSKYINLIENFGDDGCTLNEVINSNYTLDPQLIKLMTSLLIHGGWLVQKVEKSKNVNLDLNDVILNSVLQGAPYRYLCLGNGIAFQSFTDIEMILIALLQKTGGEVTPDIPERLIDQMGRLKRKFIEGTSVVEEFAQAKIKATEFVQEFVSSKLNACYSHSIL